MVVKEEVFIGKRLFDHTYSDENFRIIQVETGVEFDDAYDIHPTEFTYVESENPVLDSEM